MPSHADHPAGDVPGADPRRNRSSRDDTTEATANAMDPERTEAPLLDGGRNDRPCSTRFRAVHVFHGLSGGWSRRN
jgi:hypothetical protein